MTKRTAQELWDALDEAALDAEIESALAMTPEERRQALIEDGYDIDALHAKADAFFASLPEKVAAAASPAASSTAAPKEPSASEPVRPLAPVVPMRARKAWIPWLAAAAAIAVVGGGIGINAALTPPVVGSPPPFKADAASLRDAAQVDCDAKRWEMCRDRLDEAARADHAGEAEARVVKMREAIEAGLAPSFRK